MSLKQITLPIFGKVEIPEIIYKILLLPEVQRLRQISLSNIDSCSLTAIGGVSRFEHSIGTAILAWKLSKKLKLDNAFSSELILAAGLHDVSAPGLGHLFEEGCKLAGETFDHEKRLREIIFEEGNPHYQAYLGREIGCRKLIDKLNVTSQSVFDAIAGDGRCNIAINGSIDLDNIDNVARMLSRLGVIIPYKEVLSFIDIFDISNGSISICVDKIYLFEKWLSYRKQLYNILMLETTDFVAKSMTKLAVSIALKDKIITLDDWHLTDQELFRKLISYSKTEDLIQKLLLGQYYRLIGMYWIEGEDGIKTLKDNTQREGLHKQANESISKGVFVDYIRDKRQRYIDKSPSFNKALVGIISECSSPVKYEEELCDEFMKNHFNVLEKISLYGKKSQTNETYNNNQSLLPFND